MRDEGRSELDIQKLLKSSLMKEPLVKEPIKTPVLEKKLSDLLPSPSPKSDIKRSDSDAEDGHSLKDVKEEVKDELIDIDDDDSESNGELIDIDDEASDDDDKFIELDSDDDDVEIKEEEISSESSTDCESIEDDEQYDVPEINVSLEALRAHFVDRCLATLFQNRSPLWARPKVDAFFQDVFYRREVFSSQQRLQVEAWQARIKVLQRGGDIDVGEANNILEAHRPVVDSREMRVSLDSDSNVWSAKQTFDSRDSCGGSRVIR